LLFSHLLLLLLPLILPILLILGLVTLLLLKNLIPKLPHTPPGALSVKLGLLLLPTKHSLEILQNEFQNLDQIFAKLHILQGVILRPHQTRH
jgi:hypothetical protein